MDSDSDPRVAELKTVLHDLRKLAGSPTLLDIADKANEQDPEGAPRRATIGELLNGNFRSRSGPKVQSVIDALVDLAGHDGQAQELADRGTQLWHELNRPPALWSSAAAEHFAMLEWEWGARNVYPATQGQRNAFAISCMGPEQRAFRPEVFTGTMQAAVLTRVDWGPLRRSGGFQEYVTPSETGFRAWGPISAAYGLPRRFVSINVNAHGAIACYHFAESDFADKEISITNDALSVLVAVHALIGSRGQASVAGFGDGGSFNGTLEIPATSSEDYAGYGWPQNVVAGMKTDAGPEPMHPLEQTMRIWPSRKPTDGPLEVLGRKL